MDGTGFFLDGKEGAFGGCCLFISCKHVFYNDEKNFVEWEPKTYYAPIHRMIDGQISNGIVNFALEYKNCHPLGPLDLVAFVVSSDYLTVFGDSNADLFKQTWFKKFPRSMIQSTLLMQPKVSVFTPLAIIGYPFGLYDNVNQLPIPRMGIVASPISVDWRDTNSVGIHSTSCYFGDSGAPIIAITKSSEYILLGVHDAGFDNDFNDLEQHAEQEPYVPLPVGTYIKAYAMLVELDNLTNTKK